jgi:hypothetical protein
MLTNYFDGRTRAHNLSIAAQTKIMKSFVNIYMSMLHSRMYKIMPWKNKGFKDIKYIICFCRLYFVIVEDNSYISTMYYLLVLWK